MESEVDRLSIRERPRTRPIMHQNWGKLLFLHWRVSADMLRPLIPARLSIDTFDGAAWIGVTPFTMWGVRPYALPAVPVASKSHELNVRTYVHADGIPGVWFFSLDASNPLAVIGARVGFSLPYFQAWMEIDEQGGETAFSSRRTHPGASPAAFEARWSGGEPVPEAQSGTLDFFLVERYCLYAARGDQVLRARVHHRPWPLRQASLSTLSSTMISAAGLVDPPEPPLLHMQASPLEVDVWPLEGV